MSDRINSPWKLERYRARKPGWVINVRDATGANMASFSSLQGFDEKESLAIARLIAAGPSLLAACEAWDQGFAEGEEFDAAQFLAWVNERRRMAREAIKKAKGEGRTDDA